MNDIKTGISMKKEEIWINEEKVQVMEDEFREREDRAIDERK